MKLAYSTANGGVAIVHAAPLEALAPLIGAAAVGGPPTLSEDAYVAHVLERNGLAAAQVITLPDDWIAPNAPRGAWVLTETGEIGVDAPKAAAIYRQTYGALIDRHINATAHAKGYDSAVSLVSYRFDAAQPAWAAEAEAFFAWRSQVWAYAIGQLASVMAGEQPQPTADELMAELPPIAWPA
ncbi:MAG: hypothetical protein WC684_00480 [Hyphomicrobium sp.]|jgi:hypothetical protein